MRFTRSLRRGAAVIAALALAGTLAACAQSQRDDPGNTTSQGGPETRNTFIFAASSDPIMLDPAMASDGETFRVARQMFEGLVGTKPGTAELIPPLAESWEAAPRTASPTPSSCGRGQVPRRHRLQRRGGLRQLRPLVQLDRAEPEREHHVLLREAVQGLQDRQDRRHLRELRGARRRHRATIKLNQPFAGFVPGDDPAVVRDAEPDGDEGVRRQQHHRHGRGHPVLRVRDRSTRPAPARSSSTPGSVASRSPSSGYEDYWGEKAKVERVVIRTISRPEGAVAGARGRQHRRLRPGLARPT